MRNLEFFIEYGLTWREYNAISEAARCMIESGHRDELLRVFFNQIANAANGSMKDILADIADEATGRLESTVER